MSRRQRTPQRQELRPVQALELGIGELQRRERGWHVARELQLLARQHQHLLDLGQRPFVARWRKFAIERFQRRLLRLRFGEAVFQQRDLGLRFAQVLLLVLERHPRGLLAGFDLAQLLGELEPQIALCIARIDPDRSHADRQQQQGRRQDPMPAPTRIGRGYRLGRQGVMRSPDFGPPART